MDISVIIPVYNSEKYLVSCIESILRQEKVSLEIILVDDGSKDSSSLICDEYANKYKNIKAYHIKNSGPATARNKGFSCSLFSLKLLNRTCLHSLFKSAKAAKRLP